MKDYSSLPPSYKPRRSIGDIYRQYNPSGPELDQYGKRKKQYQAEPKLERPAQFRHPKEPQYQNKLEHRSADQAAQQVSREAERQVKELQQDFLRQTDWRKGKTADDLAERLAGQKERIQSEVRNSDIKKAMLDELDKQRQEVAHAKEHENDWVEKHNERMRKKREVEASGGYYDG